ncbi:serine/threonine-protein kinase [Nocardia blacklockiae]|uniref:serine/threonine-protein kinase n=1 Tax=Nocardia blacklockiae TaxID=480036 RepID=UPI0018948F2F|nr:serine/threonine-protein kinase [Nocardia blacklockiae]MBF6173210.1 serine/threonine protein kinase [Nocardia blacklockiae]
MSEAPDAAVARFAADWQAALRAPRPDPPPLARYVPEGRVMRMAVLADLVRIDLRQRWLRTQRGKRMADYGKEFPELAASAQFLELVCEEFTLRSRYRRTSVADFLDEYPELAAELRPLLAVGSGNGSTPPPGAVEFDSAQVRPGRRLDDFDLITLLGGADHAQVFLARQLSMQRLVAVRIETLGGHDPRTVAQLDHPYIVRVFDERVVGSVAGGPLRLQYMQYLPGGSVADLLRLRRSGAVPEGGALLLRSVDAVMAARGEIRPTDSTVRAEIAGLSWPETVAWIGRRLAAALDYAGYRGIVHRDIKPENVLFTAEGIPKLADFSAGIPESDAVQQDSSAYRAPEQRAGGSGTDTVVADARSDIYSLGVLLWEMLTGAKPSGGAEANRLSGAADAVAELPPDTPATLRRTLLRCLEADPRRRWATGAELAGQLELCLDARARDLVDPPPTSLRYRARAWWLPIVTACVGLPNLLASFYNIRLNDTLIIGQLAPADQDRYATVGLINNAVTFPLAAVLMVLLTRRAMVVSRRLRRAAAGDSSGSEPMRAAVDAEELAVARRQVLSLGDRLVWVPFAMWLLAGIAWPAAVMAIGVELPARNFVQFYTAQVVCAAIALAYPFFLVTVYAVRSVYPQLLVAGAVGPEDGRQLWALGRRANFYLAASASVPLLGVAGATLVPDDQLWLVVGPVRFLSVGGILAFVLTYRLFRLLEQDLRALTRVIPRSVR